MKDRRVSDKSYLKNGVRISVKTITIGTLEILETNFGYLWGHGLELDELTEDQKEFRETWEYVRHQIKERGKESQDILLNNINNFSVRKNRNYYDE